MSQRGNILFLILLAVVLFAALSYAVTSSMRGGGSDASPEKAQTIATQIINYATMVENTVQRLKVTGCRDTEISFQNNTFAGYTNNNAPADKHCHVFDPAGGGMSAPQWGDAELDESNSAAAYYGEMLMTGGNCLWNVGSAGGSNAPVKCFSSSSGDNAALIAFLAYLDLETCKAINKAAFGFGETVMEYNNVNANRFTGNYPIGTKYIVDFGASASGGIRDSSGLVPSMGCFTIPSNSSISAWQNKHVFFKVLLAR